MNHVLQKMSPVRSRHQIRFCKDQFLCSTSPVKSLSMKLSSDSQWQRRQQSQNGVRRKKKFLFGNKLMISNDHLFKTHTDF